MERTETNALVNLATCCLCVVICTGCGKGTKSDAVGGQNTNQLFEEKLLAKIPADIDAVDLQFSPDGSRVAYVASRGRSFSSSFSGGPSRKTGGKWWVVVDGKRGEGFDEVKNLLFSPDSKRFMYLARKGGVEVSQNLYAGDFKWFVVVDGEKGEGFGTVVEDSMRFSPDGKRTGYVAYGDKAVAVVDGIKGEAFDEIAKSKYRESESYLVFN